MNKKIWRPRMYKGCVSINREGNFFAIVCRSLREADMVEKAIIMTLIEARKKSPRKKSS